MIVEFRWQQPVVVGAGESPVHGEGA